MNKRTIIGALALSVGLAACQDLETVNLNAPDRNAALDDPLNVESLLNAAYLLTVYRRHHNTRTIGEVFPSYGEEGTSSNNSRSQADISRQPRRPINNQPEFAWHDGILRPLWEDLNECYSTGNEVLELIRIQGRTIDTPDENGDIADHTARSEAWAEFLRGTCLGYIGMRWDKGYIVHEDMIRDVVEDPVANVPDPVSYTDLLAQAVEYLESTAELAAQGHADLIDAIFGETITADDLVGLAHTQAARTLVYGARTPAERAAVAWDRVIFHAQRGVERDVFVFTTNDVNETESWYVWRTERTTNSEFQLRADYNLIGPADVSGAWEQWANATLENKLRFEIVTPDRRITGPNPDDNGLYFRHRGQSDPFNDAEGQYRKSFYQAFRWDLTGSEWFNNGDIPQYLAIENDLLLAEAYARTGQPALAAQHLNVSRANGQLPAATAAGIPGGDDCVPQLPSGACASLAEATAYERGIELRGIDPFRRWMDARGFTTGTGDDLGRLPAGTAIHFPIHTREWITFGDGVPYTFGGIGGEGSIPGDPQTN